jgi:hypothetical protein
MCRFGEWWLIIFRIKTPLHCQSSVAMYETCITAVEGRALYIRRGTGSTFWSLRKSPKISVGAAECRAQKWIRHVPNTNTSFGVKGSILYLVSTHQTCGVGTTLIDFWVEENLCLNMSINKQLYAGSPLDLLIVTGYKGTHAHREGYSSIYSWPWH